VVPRALQVPEQTAGAARDGIVMLVFDTSGTVVDWRGSIIAEGRERSRRSGIDVDWGRTYSGMREG
jgi:hypothetical protein